MADRKLFTRRPLHERFFDYVDMSGGLDACWPWTGATKVSRGGARRGKIRGDSPEPGVPGRLLLAHRVSLALYTDGVIPGPEVECAHTCDNPICVNPRHLEWKSHAENMADYIRKFGGICVKKFVQAIGKKTVVLTDSARDRALSEEKTEAIAS